MNGLAEFRKCCIIVFNLINGGSPTDFSASTEALEKLKSILKERGFNTEETFCVETSEQGNCIGCKDVDGTTAYFLESEQGIIHWSKSEEIMQFLSEKRFVQLYSILDHIPEGTRVDTPLENLIQPTTLDEFSANPDKTLRIFGEYSSLYYVSATQFKMKYYVGGKEACEQRSKISVRPGEFNKAFPEYSIKRKPGFRFLSLQNLIGKDRNERDAMLHDLDAGQIGQTLNQVDGACILGSNVVYVAPDKSIRKCKIKDGVEPTLENRMNPDNLFLTNQDSIL